jgi:hypothetical protein
MHIQMIAEIGTMSASGDTTDSMPDGEAMSAIDAPFDPKFTAQMGERTERADDLAPAKGIMLSVLLGLALWGSIVAFCLH